MSQFIVIEGTCDGAGKTTLVNGLASAFAERGTPTYLTREPGGSPFGEVVRSILLDPDIPLTPESELFLFLADRAQHTETIREKLTEGTVVISDRYSLSTLAYQGIRHGFFGGLFTAACERAQRGLIPDLTIMLDLPVELMKERLEGQKLDRFEQMGPDAWEKIRAQYLETCFSSAFSHRTVVIDATKPKEEVLALALGHYDRFFAQ